MWFERWNKVQFHLYIFMTPLSITLLRQIKKNGETLQAFSNEFKDTLQNYVIQKILINYLPLLADFIGVLVRIDDILINSN